MPLAARARRASASASASGARDRRLQSTSPPSRLSALSPPPGRPLCAATTAAPARLLADGNLHLHPYPACTGDVLPARHASRAASFRPQPATQPGPCVVSPEPSAHGADNAPVIFPYKFLDPPDVSCRWKLPQPISVVLSIKSRTLPLLLPPSSECLADSDTATEVPF